ncbi:hypothetical protein ATCVGM07011_002L [Acanthocystis turfacea Chlorella virus GM0701.1]|nr:hypothetical protein ATCVGM07011_002L [Acanthocystis turfacea Chlorella virus GM0701.1]
MCKNIMTKYVSHVSFEYEDDGAPEVSLQVVKNWRGKSKYEDLVADAFQSVYPDGLVYGVSE